jgi:hypothetical protein
MPDMINPQKGIDLINNDSIINRILFAITIFQQQVAGSNDMWQSLGVTCGWISGARVSWALGWRMMEPLRYMDESCGVPTFFLSPN